MHSSSGKQPIIRGVDSDAVRRRIADLQTDLAELDGHHVPTELTQAIWATTPSRWSLAWIPSLAGRALLLLRGRSIDGEPGHVLDYLQHAKPAAPCGPGPFARDVLPPLVDGAVTHVGDQPQVVLSSRLHGTDVRAAARILRVAYQARTGRRLFGLGIPSLVALRELAVGAGRWATTGVAGAVTGSVGLTVAATVAAIGLGAAPPPHELQIGGTVPGARPMQPAEEVMHVTPTPTAPSRTPTPRRPRLRVADAHPLPARVTASAMPLPDRTTPPPTSPPPATPAPQHPAESAPDSPELLISPAPAS